MLALLLLKRFTSVAVAATLLELEDILASKDEQRTALKAFLIGQHVFAKLMTVFVQSFVKTETHSTTCGSSRQYQTSVLSDLPKLAVI